jgi:hypothetical protein
MKKYFSIIGIFIIISLLTAGFNPFHSAKPYQTDQKPITVSGPLSGDCKGDFSFSFYPAGGPVNGSMNCVSKEYDSAGTIVKTQIITVNLSGTFQGGDGGAIIGKMSGQARAICPICTEPEITASINGQPWEGFLYANGTGNGNMLRNTRTGSMVTWSVTFSAQQFQEGLSGSASTTPDSTQSNPPETQQTAEMPASPTAGSTQSSPTQKIPILPSVQAAIQTWPTVDIAAEEILNQDGAIIARDDKGVFYAVSNGGVRKPLPEELQDRVSKDLFFLWNADLLNASPAIKALIAMDTIISTEDITGANKYFEVPPWLKEHDYMKLNTKCTDEACGSELSMPAMLGTSWELDEDGCDPSMYVPEGVSASYNPNTEGSGAGGSQAPNSSEHSSVRGTINGGGDFISVRPATPQGPGFLLFSVVKLPFLTVNENKPYMGIQTIYLNNQETIRLVQKGSPADKAGLSVGDEVVKVNNVVVDSNQPLAGLINQHQSGDQQEWQSHGVHR